MNIAMMAIMAFGGLYVFKEVLGETGDLISKISNFMKENKLVLLGIVGLLAFYWYYKTQKETKTEELRFERAMALRTGNAAYTSQS